MAERAGRRASRRGTKLGAGALLLLASSCGAPSPGNGADANAANVASVAPVAAAVAPAPVDDGRCPAPLTWGALRTGAKTEIDPVKNRLSIDGGGRLYWNDVPIDALRMRQYLDITQTMSPIPLLVVEADPKTPCDRISRLVALVGSVVDCARACTYREKAFDAKKVRPEPPPQETRVLAALHPSSPGDASDGGGCGGGRTTLTLDAESSWSPWLELAPGCALSIVIAPGDPIPADLETPYMRQCRWRQSATDDCEAADAVRFARNPQTIPAGSTVGLTLEMKRF